jgi:hypothetical protein
VPKGMSKRGIEDMDLILCESEFFFCAFSTTLEYSFGRKPFL